MKKNIPEEGFRFENVGKLYGNRQVLSNLSFTITKEEGLGIIGASGSGKSTLLRLMAGLEAPDIGTIYLHGTPFSMAGKIITPPRNRGVAMVFQDLALWPNLTVFENVYLFQEKKIRADALKTLYACGLDGMEKRYPGELSGGEQQRLALARALSTRPNFLFLDEPFNGLDMIIRNNIINKIKKLATENNITVIMVSHDPLEVLSLCSNILVLQNGQLAELGKLKNVLAAPTSEILKAFKHYVDRIAFLMAS